MTSRSFPSNPSTSLLTKTRVLFLALTISASLVILASILYFLYHLWHSLVHTTAKTIPFDSNAPLKLHRFCYRELKIATRDFDSSNVIGKGGSGSTVFRGALANGKLIAVKRLDSLSLQAEREFQNELQILGGLRSSPFLVTLLGYCVEKSQRVLVYEYMPNKSLQESLFGEKGHSVVTLTWEQRFEVILDVARALEFLHLRCDPPVIHGDVKPSNVLLDSDHRAKISDFGLSRIKSDGGEYRVDLFSQDLAWKSQEFSGNLTAETTPTTPAISTPPIENSEVDFSLALQASSSSKSTAIRNNNVKGSEKGKELVSSSASFDWNGKLVPFEAEDEADSEAKQWGKDWWWRQDGTTDQLCSKDYVTEWIGTQICPPDKSEPDGHSSPLENSEEPNKKKKKRPRKMQEWWREEHLAEITSKNKKKMKKTKTKLKIPSLQRFFYLLTKRKSFSLAKDDQHECEDNGEFSFRRGWRKKSGTENSIGSEMWSGDLLSSTTSMRGTLCYVAPEYGGFGHLVEKADIYSLGVLILVIVSGRRPLHVLASPMKLEKANLVSWCRQLAQTGNVLEAVDERLTDDYDKEDASLCLNLALSCLQKMPDLRPDIGDIVRILKGEMDFAPMPFEFSPSPPSKLYSRSRRKHKFTGPDL